MEAMSTVFLPRFLGTLPKALSPLGARARSRVMETPHSSTHTKSPGSTVEVRPRKVALSCSSRSEEPSVFF